MNYPVWYVPGFGGGLLIALVAIFHVFISHFAVGGGLYLVLAERSAIQQKSAAIKAFVKRHTKFFMLLTMVAGGLTGVAIWFIISVIHPAATSLLIHTFVFGWATEWVFFLVEIVALFVYYYTFDSMDAKTHQIIGWIYFIAAWMSLFLINGIIDFMLTPGSWLQQQNFWVGFFNPTFWPSLVFRTCMSLMLAGCYGFITAVREKDDDARVSLISFSGRWSLAFLILSLPAGWWYLNALPEKARMLVLGASPTIKTAVMAGAYGMIVVAALVIVMVLLKPVRGSVVLTGLVMVSALVYLGAFEWTREGARRPYVINEVMYSNGILVKEVDRLNKEGFLKNAKWVTNKEVTDANLLDAGRELFMHQCYACHTNGGFNNDIMSRTKNMSFSAARKYLATIHEKRYFMPPFVGTDLELKALAAYLTVGLHKKPLVEEQASGGSAVGKKLFDDNCAACHGADQLKPKMASWSKDTVRGALDKLSKLNPAMPEYTGSAADKDQMAGYLFSLNHPEAAVSTAAAAGGSGKGKGIFDDNCAACHGMDQLAPKLKSWPKAKIRSALDRLPKINSAMPDYTGSAADKEALADYMKKTAGGAQ